MCTNFYGWEKLLRVCTLCIIAADLVYLLRSNVMNIASAIVSELSTQRPVRTNVDRLTTDVPWSSLRSSGLQNIGVSNAVGRVRIYGPHFIFTLSWPCPSPSMISNSCAHASSHIMHKINPTQPLCNPYACHASKPKRAGSGDVRVDRVIERGRVKRVYPSCHDLVMIGQF